MIKTPAAGGANLALSGSAAAGRLYRLDANLRRLFRGAGRGIVTAFIIERAARGAGPPSPDGGPAPLTPSSVGTWLHVCEDGSVTVYTGKAEVGQNIRTSLSQIAADELRVPLESVNVVLGDTGLSPYDIGTFSSLTTRIIGPQLRAVGAATRELLLTLAAEAWGAARGSLSVSGGLVTDAETGRSCGFDRLAEGRELLLTVSGGAVVTPAGPQAIAGKSVPKVGGLTHVTGRHRYVSDIRLPGMLHGKILRPPAFNATLVSLDSRRAEAVGAKVVREGDFVGVAARDEATADRALAAIKSDWSRSPQPSRADVFDYFRNNPTRAEGRDGAFKQTSGSVGQGLAEAELTIKQTYTTDYIAHAPPEPRAAVARWVGDALTVWTGTQRPFAVRGELAVAFRMPEDRVRVIVPDTGSCYGGKHTAEVAVEAARLARAVGEPVRVVWERREEFAWAYFRAAGVIDITSGVRRDGRLTAWEFHNYNAGSHAILPPYSVPHQHVEFHPTLSPLRQGPYRALSATANHFARETHMDELACSLNICPLEFRLRNLTDARLRAVFEAAAAALGWGQAPRRPGRGFGIAGGVEKGGYVATCAEVCVERRSGEVKVIRVVEAFECGAVINPDHLKNQIEGAVIQGLGGAMFERVDFDNGVVLNGDFSRYRVPRFGDVPSLEVILLDRKDLPPSGAGETPIVGIAPAVGNAIFDATGVRLRSLPLVPDGLKINGGLQTCSRETLT